MKHFLLASTAIFFGLTLSAQDIEKKWQLNSGETFELKNGSFNYNGTAGDYIRQNNLMILYLNDSINSVERYKISEF
ncbi:Na+ dependent nucleoside transporter, partial [Winogradskyella litorisediminis]